MLIIGELARAGNLNYNAKVIEIVCTTNQFVYILNSYDLNKSNHFYSNRISTFYHIRDKILILHNADHYLPLKKLLKDTFSDNNKIKLCSPVIQAAIDMAKLVFIHKDIDQWYQEMLNYSEVSFEYIRHLDSNTRRKLTLFSNSLTGWIIADTFRYISKVHIYAHYQQEPHMLYSLYKHSKTRESCYIKLFDEPFEKDLHPKDITLGNWSRLTHQEKIKAILEIIYVHTLHDELYEQYLVKDEFPKDLAGLIFVTYMQLVCSNVLTQLRTYAIEYFEQIVDLIDIHQYKMDTLNYMKYSVFEFK